MASRCAFLIGGEGEGEAAVGEADALGLEGDGPFEGIEGAEFEVEAEAVGAVDGGKTEPVGGGGGGGEEGDCFLAHIDAEPFVAVIDGAGKADVEAGGKAEEFVDGGGFEGLNPIGGGDEFAGGNEQGGAPDADAQKNGENYATADEQVEPVKEAQDAALAAGDVLLGGCLLGGFGGRGVMVVFFDGGNGGLWRCEGGGAGGWGLVGCFGWIIQFFPSAVR